MTINLILTVTLTSLLFVLFKLFKSFNVNLLKIIIINYLVAALIGGGFVMQKHSTTISQLIDSKLIIGSVWLAFLFIAIFNLLGISTQKNGLAAATIASKTSLIIPVFFGVFYLNEHLKPSNWVGILCAFAAIILINLNKSSNFKHQKESYLILLGVFLGTGIIETSLNFIEKFWINNNQTDLFSSLIFFTAGLIGFIILFFKQNVSWNRKEIIFGICLGIPNYFSIFYLIKTLQTATIDSSKVFVIINISTILLSSFLGIFLFKERLKPLNYLGIILAISTIFLIS